MVVLLEPLTGFSHTGLVSPGAQDLVEDVAEVLAGGASLLTRLGAGSMLERPPSFTMAAAKWGLGVCANLGDCCLEVLRCRIEWPAIVGYTELRSRRECKVADYLMSIEVGDSTEISKHPGNGSDAN